MHCPLTHLIYFIVESICKFIPPTGKEKVSPRLEYYTQYMNISISCPPDMGLDSNSNNRYCTELSEWDEQLPQCVNVGWLLDYLVEHFVFLIIEWDDAFEKQSCLKSAISG